ncbi:methyltransferase domain-containing protein [Candidatus Parcubacteria bacterium]|nr:methyltransferase domain-containing protein [Candidatus Parcubacteria bacterium]
MKKDTSWGNVADWYKKYLDDPDSYQSQVILPQLIRLLTIKKGQKILDLACGTGFFSEVFQAQGAEVIGVDIASELIDIARLHASKDIQFIVSPAHKLGTLQTQSIDTVVIILAIQNIKEVKEMLAECKRVLKKDGKITIVMNHPAYRIPGGSSWEWHEQQGRQYRRIDAYLSEKTVEISMHPGKDPHTKTVSFHRPIQYYAKLAHNSGFAISRIEEWISHKTSEIGPRQKEEDRMRKEIPLFMFLELSQFGNV